MKYLFGVGNYSMFDDSIGIKVVEYISEQGLDKNFQAIDLSGNAINLLAYFNEETESIVIVDSANLGLNPGEYKIFAPSQVESVKELAGISTHEGDIVKIITLAKETGYTIPPIKFLGIEPLLIQNEFGLSKKLEDNLNVYAKAAIDLLDLANLK